MHSEQVERPVDCVEDEEHDWKYDARYHVHHWRGDQHPALLDLQPTPPAWALVEWLACGTDRQNKRHTTPYQRRRPRRQ